MYSISYYRIYKQTTCAHVNTHDMFTGFMSSGVHVYVFFSNEALVGRGDSRVTATVSPSGSDVVTVRVFCCPWVTLKTLSTVMLGLALAADEECLRCTHGLMYN